MNEDSFVKIVELKNQKNKTRNRNSKGGIRKRKA